MASSMRAAHHVARRIGARRKARALQAQWRMSRNQQPNVKTRKQQYAPKPLAKWYCGGVGAHNVSRSRSAHVV